MTKARMPKPVTSLADLTPDPQNARKHNPRNIGQVQNSLQKYGAARSIVIDENNQIIAGHGVVEAAGLAGIERVQVVEADGETIIAVRRTGLTKKQKVELGIADNRGAELAEWNTEVLAGWKGSDVDLEQFWGKDELEKLVPGWGGGNDAEDPGPQIDRAAELQAKWGTALGQLWAIGRHRLLVGDCTVATNHGILMQGDMADMVFTDPPYGVDYDGGLNETKREKLSGDTSAALYRACFAVALEVCKPSAPLYVWFAETAGKPVYDAVSEFGYTVRAMIVWNKLDAHYGNFMAQYMQKHEPCLYCVKASPPWFGPTNEVTVWDVKQPTVNEFHPTQKPLELAERAIRNSSAPDAIVADWFLGSGTTLVACEKLGRIGRGMELSPAYAAVTLERLSGLGLTPELVD